MTFIRILMGPIDSKKLVLEKKITFFFLSIEFNPPHPPKKKKKNFKIKVAHKKLIK